jgi:ferredoxin
MISQNKNNLKIFKLPDLRFDMVIHIDYKKCCWKEGKCSTCSCGAGNSKKCFGCAEVCPQKAIMREKIIIVDAKKCIDCGICVEACKY